MKAGAIWLIATSSVVLVVTLWNALIAGAGVSRHLAVSGGILCLMTGMALARWVKRQYEYLPYLLALVAGLTVYLCLLTVDEFVVDFFSPNLLTLCLAISPIFVYEYLFERPAREGE